MNEQKTHADIIAEMRMFKCRNLETGELELCNAIGNYFADRLEAALKREMSKNVSKNVADLGQLGDCAKLREALEATLDLFRDIHNANRSPQSNQAYAVIKQIKAALSATPSQVPSVPSVPPVPPNVAKLREALQKAAESTAEIMERIRHKDGLAFNIANYIAGVARTALAAPARNCDKYTTVKDAAIAFAKAKNNLPHPIPDFTFSAWLLDTAAESEVAK